VTATTGRSYRAAPAARPVPVALAFPFEAGQAKKKLAAVCGVLLPDLRVLDRPAIAARSSWKKQQG